MSVDNSQRVCCTCLSEDRKLFQLCRVPEGVNLLYMLLLCDSEAYREGFFKDTASWMVCWECRAILKKIMQFRSQTCLALKSLKEYADGRNTQTELQSLSRLSTYNHPAIMNEIDSIFEHCNLDANKMKTEEIDNNTDIENVTIDEIDSETIKISKKKSKSKKYTLTTMNNTEFNAAKHKSLEIKDVFKCESCALDFKDESALNSHVLESHTKKKSPTAVPGIYSCSECDMTFDNKGTKWKHIQKCHRAGHKCDTCQKVFTFKHNLQRHQLDSHPRSECPHCLKQVRTSLLAAHVRVHSERARFACEPCGKGFICRATYESHLKYATAHAGKDSLKHSCNSCDKRFRSRGELRDHVAYRHEAQPIYKCPVCDKALATRRCVTRHVRRTHDGVQERARDKMCDYCGLAFKDKQSLTEHVRRHTGARPLSCARCGRSFRQRAALHAHTRRTHIT